MNGTEKKDLDLLIDGLQRMALKLSDQMIDQLMTYLNLVEKWNRVYNLTAIRERDQMIKLHFLDSLSILNHVHVKKNIRCRKRRWISRHCISNYKT